ncbi:MAG TPA: DUF4846 domain-containing protein [Clostridia bacterium]|nr:DUF4846 domain-containing protein [Clostridia bacterium]
MAYSVFCYSVTRGIKLKRRIVILCVCLWIFTGCVNMDNSQLAGEKAKGIINESGLTIGERANVPKEYTRVEIEENSFAAYLRNLPLKEHKAKVLYYNGKIKENYGVYEAVVDMEIGTKNLQQCADAVMRLRGEYLYQQKKWGEIHFNLTNGFRVDYSKWMQGYRVIVDGNKTYWEKKSQELNSYDSFRKYMDFVFTYAGTLSLSKELQTVKLEEMQSGDVFIQGGSPGHAVIVVDMAENQETGEKLYMLAQSYMPAQDIQILANPNNREISPWYVLSADEKICTPEWVFTKDDLMRFFDE